MKIAIIGTGISGLATAYMLAPYHDVTVFEANDYLGGHSRTINIKVNDKKEFPVDTGFIVFNKRNYPHLTKLFDHLKVKYEKSDMSFGVSIDNGWLEYSSKRLFAQKQNFFRISFLKMLKDILYFNHKAAKLIKSYPNDTVDDFINRMSLGRWFNEYYLSAMGGCIWSTSISEVKRFPAKMLIQFFDNHGLLTINNQPQWYTVSGGSREYVNKISHSYQNNILVNTPVCQIERFKEHVCLTDYLGNTYQFDKVIMACHPDEALNLIKQPDDKEKHILGCFTY